MSSAKMITFVKPSTLEHKRGLVKNHDAAILALVKDKPMTFAEMFAILDADKTWLGNSKQTVKSVLSGRLSKLRKDGAIVNKPVSRVTLMENIKELSAVVEEKRAEIKSARSAAKKAVRAENYKKRKAAFMEMEEKVKCLEARILATESAAEVLVNEATAKANDLQEELLASQDTIRSYSSSLMKLERENISLSSSYSNLICAEMYIFMLCLVYYISINPTIYEPGFRYMLDM